MTSKMLTSLFSSVVTFLLILSTIDVVNGAHDHSRLKSKIELNKLKKIVGQNDDHLTAEFACPPIDSIAPCICDENSLGWPGRSLVKCSGFDGEVTQQLVDSVVETVRNFNGVPPNERLRLIEFDLMNTEMTEFDFTPLLGLQLDWLSVSVNEKLVKVHPPNSSFLAASGKDFGKQLKTLVFDISFSPLLGDEGLGDIVRYLDPTLTHLILAELGLKGPQITAGGGAEGHDSPNAQEFLPGLFSLTQLRNLLLSYNEISKISGGQFRQNNRLIQISLYSNLLTEVGQFALTLDDPDADLLDVSFYVDLGRNMLTNFSIHPENGMELSKRPIDLMIHENDLDHLAESIFYPFLNAHPLNNVLVEDLPLVCDVRMKYLKDAATIYEPRVIKSSCINDPGHSIFDSGMIP